MCSCIGGCCAGCVTSCLDRCGSSGSFIPYIILLFISSALALILRYWGGPLTIHLYVSYNVYDCGDTCVGYGVVYRIAFALVLFFLFHLIILLFGMLTLNGTGCAKIGYGGWLWKILLFIVFIIAAWLIPDTFYQNGFVHIARIGAAIFLLLQIIVLIDFAYRWQEAWNQDERNLKWLLFVCSLVFYGLSIALLVCGFIYLSGPSCSIPQFFLGFTIALTVILTFIAISPYIDEQKGGLLPVAVISFYCYWLCFTSLASNPDSCNSLSQNNNFQLISGIIIGTLSIAYSAHDISTSNHLFGGPSLDEERKVVEDMENQANVNPSASSGSSDLELQNNQVSQPKIKQSGSAGSASEVHEDEDTLAKIAKRSRRFHGLMIFSSMYMAMLLTNWGSLQGVNASDPNVAYDLSKETMWVKIITQWVTVLLFLWTLIASKVCSSRSFD